MDRVSGFVAAAVAVVSSSALAASFDVVALSGEAAPGGGTFQGFSDGGGYGPVINDAGEVAFRGWVSSGGTTLEALFRGSATSVEELARQGQPAPGTGKLYGNEFSHSRISETGDVAFIAKLDGSSLYRDAALFVDSGGTTQFVFAIGGDAPGGGSFQELSAVKMSDNGYIAFAAFASRRQLATVGPDGPVEVVRNSDETPVGGRYVLEPETRPFAINTAGDVAFQSLLVDVPGAPSSTSEAISLYSGGNLRIIARSGDDLAHGTKIAALTAPFLNNAGQMVFGGFFNTTGELSYATSDTVLLYFDEEDGLSELIRAGDTTPRGSTFQYTKRTAFNDRGDVAVVTSNSSPRWSESILLFTSEGVTEPVRTGDETPHGDGRFSSLQSLAFNDAGQFAFLASLVGTDAGFNSDFGLFFFDPTLGLMKIIQEGDSFLGSTVSSVALAGSADDSSLNDLGQLAYRFHLKDGRSGVAIWSIPEPGAAALLGAGCCLLLSRRRAV